MRPFINKLARGIAEFLIRILVFGVCVMLLGWVGRQVEHRMGVTRDVSTFLVCGVTLAMAFGLMIATRVISADSGGPLGFLLRRARRIVTGTTVWDWAVLIGISFAWHFTHNGGTLPERGPLVGTAWVVGWFVVFPKPRAPKVRVTKSDAPRAYAGTDATADEVVEAEIVEQLTPGD